jgi:uncharacterized glyoxalase superfamily protein PhnB
MAKFGMAFNIGSTNEERIEAFEMYQNAFNAKKVSEMKPPGSSDIHIVMEICGITILLAPGFDVVKNLNNPLCCEIHFDNESDIRNAYEFLYKDSLNYSIEGPYPWAKVLALVTDKFGIGWALYFNE